jgi:hypothetical protein
VVALDAEPAAVTPTLSGRIQTRLALLALVGVPWAMVIIRLLPGDVRARQALAALLVIAVLGVGWELLYHACQQLRWDRDWPSLFALVVGVPEGALAWLVLHQLGLATPSPLAHVLFFGTTWLLIWLVIQGPIRVLAPRWRHTGGRLVRRRVHESRPAEAISPAAPAADHPRRVTVPNRQEERP